MRTTERKINYYETDQMGIVHHSNYIRYFEEGRIGFMEQAGYPFKRLEDEGIVSPTLAVSCRYIHAVRFGDTVHINVRLTKMSRLKCSFSYKITDAETGEIRARGTSEHGFIDTDGRPAAMDRKNPDLYNAFLKELEPEEGAK